MSNVKSMSVSMDYLIDGDDHKVELDYWDSEGNESNGSATSDNFEDCVSGALEDLMMGFAKPEEDKYAEYNGDLQEYIEDLEAYIEELEEENNALLETVDRLEYRCFETSKPVEVKKSTEYSKYDNSAKYTYDTKSDLNTLNKELTELLKAFGL